MRGHNIIMFSLRNKKNYLWIILNYYSYVELRNLQKKSFLKSWPPLKRETYKNRHCSISSPERVSIHLKAGRTLSWIVYCLVFKNHKNFVPVKTDRVLQYPPTLPRMKRLILKYMFLSPYQSESKFFPLRMFPFEKEFFLPGKQLQFC